MRKPTNSGNQSKEQIPLFQDHHLHQLMEFNGFKRNQLVFGLNYTRKFQNQIAVWNEITTEKYFRKKRIDGCSAGKTFSKSAQFSTPIVHQMDDQNNDIPYQQK